MRNLFEGENVNLQCLALSGGDNLRFPCDVDAPTAVSVAIGAGGLALLFVFYLMAAVSLDSSLLVWHAHSSRKYQSTDG